jgi:hypothetical protein
MLAACTPPPQPGTCRMAGNAAEFWATLPINLPDSIGIQPYPEIHLSVTFTLNELVTLL